MFQPPIFSVDDKELMHELMLTHPFGTLISIQDGGITADHLPLVIHPELSEQGTIRAHIAKGNPLWLKRKTSMEILAIFQGPQAYITPSWYPSKKQHGKVVPTWNYAVIHAHGELNFRTDEEWLLDHLVELSNRQEDGRYKAWKVSDAPDSYIAKQLKGIVGIEIEIKKLEGQWKVSQNKNEEDRTGVQEGLKLEADQVANSMSELVREFGK